MEALRQMRNDVGPENTMYVHVTFLPYIGASRELKTKPTQHSVRELRGIGIQPDVIIARADHPIPEEHIKKISLFCNVEEAAVIPAVTADALYAIPVELEKTNLGDFVVERLGLAGQTSSLDLQEWKQLVAEIRRPKPTIKVGLVGKYVELHDAYLSVKEAVAHAGIANNRDVEIVWIHSGQLEKGKGWGLFDGLDL